MRAGRTRPCCPAIWPIGSASSKPKRVVSFRCTVALARSLYEAGLIDELRLLVFPVCVGTGKRLFGDGEPPSGFNLVDSKITTSGVVYSALTPAPFQFGEVGLEDGREKI